MNMINKSESEIISNDNESLRNYEIINIFNQNFKCNKVQNILAIYEIKNGIWQHPLLLNKDYCFFCLEKPKTKYSINSLKETHLQMNNNELIEFFNNNSILFRHCKTKIERIKNRRFIKSSEKRELINYSKENENLSDTEIFFTSKNPKISKKNKLTLSLSSEMKRIPSEKNNSIDMNNSKINILKNINNYNSDFEKILIENDIEKDSNSNILNQKPIINPFKENKLSHIKINIKENNDLKIAKNKSKSPLNKSLLKNGFTFFSSIVKNFTKKHSSHYSKPEIPSPNFEKQSHFIYSSQNIEESNKKYSIKNEICSLCLGEIEDKFVLGCGDFYCRECIRNIIIGCINDISKFEKMICPTCNEKIEENFIHKLITEKEYEKYKKLKKRIEGLKNKDLIPCPYPDCESFGIIELISKNFATCQNNHIFCIKCLKIISDENRKEEHKCENEKKNATYKYLYSQKTIRKCPNCNTWVQREENGCNNMTCSNIWCNYEFCWICGNKYDSSHYKNPFSTCFGLQESTFESKFARYKSARVLKCFGLFIFLIFVIFPIIICFFSFVVVGIYFVTFILDGTHLKRLKLKKTLLNKVFYISVYLNYAIISLSLLSFGYICFIIFIIFVPIFCIIQRINKKKIEENEYI